jgi:hypothetical protein
MSLIKIILVLLPLSLVYVAFARTRTTHVKAYQRILFLGFIAFIIIAFVFPLPIRKFARSIGMPNGNYLVVYVFVIAFIFSIIAIYLKFNEMSHKIVKLSRRLALLESKIETKKTKK